MANVFEETHVDLEEKKMNRIPREDIEGWKENVDGFLEASYDIKENLVLTFSKPYIKNPQTKSEMVLVKYEETPRAIFVDDPEERSIFSDEIKKEDRRTFESLLEDMKSRTIYRKMDDGETDVEGRVIEKEDGLYEARDLENYIYRRMGEDEKAGDVSGPVVKRSDGIFEVIEIDDLERYSEHLYRNLRDLNSPNMFAYDENGQRIPPKKYR